MNIEPTQEIMDVLDTILEDERNVLLAGKLDEIPDLLGRKEELFDRLSDVNIESGAALEELQSKVTRNQALLEGALRGIRSVADRMSALRHMRHSLDTYDQQGQRQTITIGSENKLEKRA